MKNLKLVALLLLILCIAVVVELSQVSVADEPLASDTLSGRYWVDLDGDEKVACINGIVQGIILCSKTPKIRFNEVGIDKATIKEIYHKQTIYLPRNISTEEAVDYINGYYKTESNLDNAINTVYWRMVADGLAYEGHLYEAEFE